MIVTEFYREREDGVKLYRTYSDQNRMMLQDGTNVLYSEAIDPENSGRTYTETDEPIPTADETDDLAEAARILLGVRE